MTMQIELKNVCKRYGKHDALNDFSYTFQDGVYGILGSNGAGKSTLMNLLTDTILRTSGEILWNGKEILSLGASYRNVLGYMPQQENSVSKLTVLGFLNYIGFLKGIDKKSLKIEVANLSKELNFAEYRHKRICDLSGGMRQRVLLAQALLGNPQILLLDEPTAGLDPQERIRIRNLLLALSGNKIILLATHIVSDVECIADQVLLMKNGRLIKSGTSTELISGITPYVCERKCERHEVAFLQQKHFSGRVLQKADGLYFRWLEEKKQETAYKILDIGLEEVFIGINNNIILP